jgi:hypothetical protein
MAPRTVRLACNRGSSAMLVVSWVTKNLLFCISEVGTLKGSSVDIINDDEKIMRLILKDEVLVKCDL